MLLLDRSSDTQGPMSIAKSDDIDTEIVEFKRDFKLSPTMKPKQKMKLAGMALVLFGEERMRTRLPELYAIWKTWSILLDKPRDPK
jgi:hypothetical protein